MFPPSASFKSYVGNLPKKYMISWLVGLILAALLCYLLWGKLGHEGAMRAVPKPFNPFATIYREDISLSPSVGTRPEQTGSDESESRGSDTQAYTPSERVLLDKSEKKFVLQVANLASAAAAEAFIAQCSPADQVRLNYYRRKSRSTLSYVVIYGEYESKEAALHSLQALPERLRQSAPWPRRLAEIQQELRKNEL